jgi:hypothetical protein
MRTPGTSKNEKVEQFGAEQRPSSNMASQRNARVIFFLVAMAPSFEFIMSV